jgi:hypothetical protein
MSQRCQKATSSMRAVVVQSGRVFHMSAAREADRGRLPLMLRFGAKEGSGSRRARLILLGGPVISCTT